MFSTVRNKRTIESPQICYFFNKKNTYKVLSKADKLESGMKRISMTMTIFYIKIKFK